MRHLEIRLWHALIRFRLKALSFLSLRVLLG